MSDYLQTCYEDGYIGTFYDLQGQGVPLCIPINQEEIVQAVQLDSKISGGMYESFGEDTKKLKKTITSEVSRGVSTGMSYQQVAKQIELKMIGTKYKPGGAYAHALTVARTEGHRIQCQSAMNACTKAKERGADVVKQWDSTLDGNTRESHRAVDGEVRELEDKFSNGLMYPGNSSGPASEVCNCRCALLQRARWALEDNFTKMNNETGEIIDFSGVEDYEEFKKSFREQVDTIKKNAYNSGTDKEQFERYSKVLKDVAPKSLNSFSKIKYDNPDEWKSLKAKYRIVNQYKIDSGNLSPVEILELDGRVITEKRTKFTSKYNNSGNIAGAYINGNKSNMYFAHSKMSNSSKGYNGTSDLVPLKDKRRFSYIDVLRTDGTLRNDTHVDTEAKLFERFADLYEQEHIESITMLSERGMCDSCKWVMTQFKKLYPNVTVNVVSNKKVTSNVWKYRKSGKK